ncbi:O-antigen ligase family protein [Poseidonibacter ostreae]|uniref:O-antigen ligase family protein n=2 Tax=Poseidonibacter ostreae TaxID=2654171 RepID=A0A6L4WS91_9BACT|nr:O-antigen ligase family protein [Poseidonibacter ostreae]
MIVLGKDIEDKNIFKILVFIWIMSIPFKNAVYQISVITIIVFFLYYLIKFKNFSILFENLKNTKYLFLGFFSIILSMIISNLFNLEYLDNKSWHIIYMFVIRYGLIFVILIYFYKLDFFNKKEIIATVLLSLIFLMFTGIYEIIGNMNVVMSRGILGTLDNRNTFGLFMGMGVVLSLLIVKDYKLIGLVLILMFSFFMIFSFSRSSWVASTSSIFILFILNYKKIKIVHLGYIVIFLTFLITLYFNFDSFQNRFDQLISGYSSNRIEIWMHTIALIKDNFIFGYGIDSWNNLPDSYLVRFPNPHNLFLEILINIGLLGLGIYIFTVMVIIVKIISSKNFILLPVASYFLIVTLFDFSIFTSKELLSFLTIFIFLVYSNDFKKV